MRWHVLIAQPLGCWLARWLYPLAPGTSLPLTLSHWPDDLKWHGYERISTPSMPNCATPKRSS